MKVISQAPTRISLFGGGTDVGEYAQKYGGFCLNMAINIRQKFIMDTDSKEPSNFIEDSNEKFYEVFFSEYGITPHCDQHFENGINTGLGSSAAAAVALIGGLNRIKGIWMTKEQIAELAWDIEVNKVGLYGGKQDQYASVMGGVNAMEFGEKVNMVNYPPAFINPIYKCMTLFNLGIRRRYPNIQEGLRFIRPWQKESLDQLKKIAITAVEYLHKGDAEAVGRLLQLSWYNKKQSNERISKPMIEKIIHKAEKLGAWGGKVLGAGGGGHVFFISPPEVKPKLIEQLGLRWIDFSIDWNGLETRIL